MGNTGIAIASSITCIYTYSLLSTPSQRLPKRIDADRLSMRRSSVKPDRKAKKPFFFHLDCASFSVALQPSCKCKCKYKMQIQICQSEARIRHQLEGSKTSQKFHRRPCFGAAARVSQLSPRLCLSRGSPFSASSTSKQSFEFRLNCALLRFCAVIRTVQLGI